MRARQEFRPSGVEHGWAPLSADVNYELHQKEVAATRAAHRSAGVAAAIATSPLAASLAASGGKPPTRGSYPFRRAKSAPTSFKKSAVVPA